MNFRGIELQESEGNYYFENNKLVTEYCYVDVNKKHGDSKNIEYRRLQSGIRRMNFINRNRLRELKTKYSPVWAKLLNKNLRSTLGIKTGFNFKIPQKYLLLQNMEDHVELYRLDDQIIYTIQPYGVTLEKYLAYEKLWLDLDFFTNISIDDAWYFPGRTPLIVVSKEFFPLSHNV